MCDEKIETVIIIGAGISGLLLARYLTEHNVPYRIYERRTNLETLNEGWGLTLHWSLPTLRDLLGESFSRRLPEAYVDNAAVERGEASAFPFFDLSTGELKFKTPLAPESQRIRVSRQKFRRLLASDIKIEVTSQMLLFDLPSLHGFLVGQELRFTLFRLRHCHCPLRRWVSMHR